MLSKKQVLQLNSAFLKNLHESYSAALRTGALIKYAKQNIY